MISTWLATQPLDWFLSSHFGREPLVRPSAARDAIPLLTWATIERLVAAGAQMLVVRNGVRRAGKAPATRAEARGLLDRGYSMAHAALDLLSLSVGVLCDEARSEARLEPRRAFHA